MKITTLPVYSKLADENAVKQLGLWDKLPINSDGKRWQLSEHQVETYKALTSGDLRCGVQHGDDRRWQEPGRISTCVDESELSCLRHVSHH